MFHPPAPIIVLRFADGACGLAKAFYLLWKAFALWRRRSALWGRHSAFWGRHVHFGESVPHFAEGVPHFGGSAPHFAEGVPHFGEGAQHFAERVSTLERAFDSPSPPRQRRQPIHTRLQRREYPAIHLKQVTVNLWVTPDLFNLRPNTGGLRIWSVVMESDYYGKPRNEQMAVVAPVISDPENESCVIEYKCNRAVIFDARAVHCTEPFEFSTRFSELRSNVTFLFANVE